MNAQKEIATFIKNLLNFTPESWLKLTTHRLDIYNEKRAKIDFLDHIENIYKAQQLSKKSLTDLPTAYDYIRLGHPLSCLLEWALAKANGIAPQNVISFSSQTMPLLAILRKNLIDKKNTRVFYQNTLPSCFDENLIKRVYNYNFELIKIDSAEQIPASDECTVFISKMQNSFSISLHDNIDFLVQTKEGLGSLIVANNIDRFDYISDIQHVRRRETIAMTPLNCYNLMGSMVDETHLPSHLASDADKISVLHSIHRITHSSTHTLLGSSGLSIQYAVLMGLIDSAMQTHPEKSIKIIVPPNCYGGTNDQARRVAECLAGVEIVDLLVDDGQNMVHSLSNVLTQIAQEDAIPFIIAEIPTNPRVEVPDLVQLGQTLSKKRKTNTGALAIEPVFILDQTFCPNVNFLGEDQTLSNVKTISYVSGSKFPSGGLCTAGYCASNTASEYLMSYIEDHLNVCDNQATQQQMSVLASQLPSMNQRIQAAYKNTREFVNYIAKVLPQAKINFVSEELAQQGFTPSVFSLDLPTQGGTSQEKETYKRDLNHKLIKFMVDKIPHQSKHCVSYGQLNGCYWTVPATSTQGTTREGDKDYIVRVAMAPELDLDLHKNTFKDFVQNV